VINVRSSRRRLTLSIIGLLAAVLLFSGRLIDIQVVHAAALNKESLGKRSVAVVTYGERGNIVDANGVLLASSVDRFDITASPKVFALILSKTKDPSGLMEKVQELAEATGVDSTTLTTALTKDPESDFAYVAKSVTLEVRDRVKDLKLSWVYPRVHPSRTYPNGAVAGNLVGFMNTDGPGAGLERSYNECLSATNGSSTYEKSKDGVLLPGSTVTQKEAVNGGTLKLTIDSDFQWYVQEQLAAQAQATGSDWATAVVVRVSDGHLMAVADYPSVDPNNVDGVPKTALGSLAFSTPYEPGSTFKPMTAAMLLDQGAASPNTGVTVPGRIYFPTGQYIRDVWAHSDLRLTLTGVLMNSSNVGISLFSDKLDKQTRYDYFKKFGLGTKTDVKFGGESAGTLLKPAKWDPITNYAVTFGQGVTATSAQVASIYQTLGNGGVRMPLTLVEGCELPDGTVVDLPSTKGTRVVSEAAAKTTVSMLETIVTKGPISNLLNIPGYRMAAKSGTAEVPVGGVYTKQRIVSVAGMIPAENPQYAVVVTLGKPDTIKTSAAAAPTFKNIMTQVIKTFRIQPSTKPAADLATEW
jgi:cell division protein FtsI (penicillin-binding protein 3)